MSRSTLPLLTALLLLSFGANPVFAGEPEVDDTWDTLFDSDQWKKDARKWQRPFPKIWTFKNGEIIGKAGLGQGEKHPEWKGGILSFVISKKEYRTFHVSVEVKLEKGKYAIGQWGRGKTFFDQGVCRLNEWHQLRMTIYGDRIDCWINGNKLNFYGRPETAITKGLYLFCKEDSVVRFRNVRAKAFRE
jgi:hypothetical protein